MKPLESRALHLLFSTGNGWADPKQITSGMGLEPFDPLRTSYRIWNYLTRMGYMERRDNSEQVRGEKRVNWSEFRMTAKGKTMVGALTDQEMWRD